MFCSKCGEKLGEDDKFCKKCGRAVSSDKTSDKKDDQPTSVTAKRQPQGCSKGCIWSFLVLLFIIFLGALLGYHEQIKSSVGLKIVFYSFGAFFLLMFGWGVIRRGKKSVHDHRDENHEKPRKSGACSSAVAIVSVVVMLGVLFFIFGDSKNINFLQDDSGTPGRTQTTNDGGSTKETTEKTTDWDGNYNAQVEKPNCDSPVELTAFQVSGNKVMNLYGSSAPIGDDNRATMTMNYGDGMTVNFAFSQSGGTNVANGTWSAGNCSGTFQARSSF